MVEHAPIFGHLYKGMHGHLYKGIWTLGLSELALKKNYIASVFFRLTQVDFFTNIYITWHLHMSISSAHNLLKSLTLHNIYNIATFWIIQLLGKNDPM